MWCVRKGKICIMVQDTKRKDKNGFCWVYIPEKQWYSMTEAERRRFV